MSSFWIPTIISGIKNKFKPIPKTITSKYFLKLTKDCNDRVQRMLKRNVDGSMSRLRVNRNQCEYIAKKLKLAVQKAEMFLTHSQGSSSSEGEMAHCLDDIKLLHNVACAVENFIQICCMDAWVATVLLIPNMSQDTLSISFDLALLANFFSEFYWMQVEIVNRDEATFVIEKAASDRDQLSRDVKALLRTMEDKTSEEFGLAESLEGKLETVGAYRTNIENLTIGNLLGSGGFAKVYKSKWLGIDVAAKLSRVGPSSSIFQEEVKLLGRLSHPNVASMFCYAEDDKEHSIVMELMDGDLSEMMRSIMRDRSRNVLYPFSMIEAVDIMLQTGKGVEYLHEKKIVHRDLKAANILVKRLGNWENGESKNILAKVGDVGISKEKERSMTSSPQTFNVGTRRWMAPEVIRKSPIGEQIEVSSDSKVMKYPYASDVHSYGMLCYEILTGSEPYFEVESLFEVKEKILRGDRPQLPQHCLPELGDLIKRCWSQEPSKRPRFKEICAHLRKIRFHLLFSGGGSMLYNSRVFSMLRPRFNHSQCKYLAEKLMSVVQEAQMCLTHPQGSSISEGKMTHRLNLFKMLHNVASVVKNFIQNCCKDAWIAAALLMPNMSQDALSISFDLALLANFFSGNSVMEVESVYNAEASIVTQIATSDRHLFLRNVGLLRAEGATSSEYQLAELLVKQLESSRAYHIEIESLTPRHPMKEGDNAAVYKSKWLGLDVAVKMLPASSSSLYFQREVSILRCLSHPNITSMFCYVEDDRESSIVMELMDCDLSEMMRNITKDKSKGLGSPFSIFEAVDIMLQIGKGVEYLHEMKIFHRCLKAANIVVKQVGDLDVGQSKSILAKVGGFGTSTTEEKSMILNPQTTFDATRWMAPEVIPWSFEILKEFYEDIEVIHKYSYQSDSYSFGMVCYEILTGVYPYFEMPGNSYPMVIQILSGVRPELPQLCLSELRDMIERCWSHYPSKRPCFDEICAKLRAIRFQLLFSGNHRVHEGDFQTIGEIQP